MSTLHGYETQIPLPQVGNLVMGSLGIVGSQQIPASEIMHSVRLNTASA